jgi:hypothetical protein
MQTVHAVINMWTNVHGGKEKITKTDNKYVEQKAAYQKSI